MIITNEVFRSYSQCKLKSFLVSRGRVGNKCDYELMQDDLIAEHRASVVATLLKRHSGGNITDCGFQKHVDLQKHSSLVLHTMIQHKDLYVKVDALEGTMTGSGSGSHAYLPILFTPSEKVTRENKLLVCFIAHVLGNFQGQKVQWGKILYGPNCRITKIRVNHYETEIRFIIEAIRGFRGNDSRPRVMLRNHCQICEFREQCEKEAKEMDHLSLLRGMTEKEVLAQNRKGIFTVTQFSYTFNPRRTRKRAKNPTQRRYHSLQALSLREKKIFVYGKLSVRLAPVCIYMDVESDPERDFVYLVGLLIDDRDGEYLHSFWVDTRDQQDSVIEQFLNVIRKFDDFLVFHYGSHESRFLESLKRYQRDDHSALLDTLIERSINVLTTVFASLYFPVYYNSLKSIAEYLGHKWNHKDLSGLNSIVARREWERTRDSDLKARLMAYNLEDCNGLRKLVQFCHRISVVGQDKDNMKEESDVVFAEHVDFKMGRRFKKNSFVIDDFNHINKCAYYDYHRDKIFLRTNDRLRRVVSKRAKRKRSKEKANKVIELNSINQCPRCQCNKFRRNGHYMSSVVDLKLLRDGVKKWVVAYRVQKFRCAMCNKGLTARTNGRERYQRYGSNLVRWVMYEHIVKGVSLEKIQTSLQDLFDLSVSRTELHNFKFRAADYYETTYDQILWKLFRGRAALHIDETSVRMVGAAGYVWTFTNMEEVAFIPHSGKLLTKMRQKPILTGF